MDNVVEIKKQTREQRQREKIEEQMQEIEKQNAMIAQMLYDEEENG
tara:strand:+ start:1110 stop:1247 length:138 start_codon:yes stop_codon:yes gene_type:complete